MRLKLKFNMCLVFVIIVFILLNTIILFSNLNKKKIQNDFFRLHIVANSNISEDQKLKIAVAKAVSDYLCRLYNEGLLNSKDEAKKVVIKNIDNLLEISNNIVLSNGYNYHISAHVGKINYDRKQNSILQMAKGNYDSIRIVIGDGMGENFWSLVYPSSYSGSYEFNEEKNTDENIDTEYILEREDIIYEFKFVEWLKNIFNN